MTTLEQRAAIGSRAKEVLENECFIEAFDATEKELTEQWQNSPARDAEGREKLWQYLMMLRKVKAHLVQTMETGKLAQIDLAHKQSQWEKAREWLGDRF